MKRSADELIKRYGIALTSNNRLGIRNGAAVDRDNAMNELKARKDEIIERLTEQKAEKEKAAADRAAKIAAIEGLSEIRRAQAEIEEWDYRFEKSFEDVGGMGVGPKPNYDLEAMYKKYPAARAYLRAEEYAYKTNDELSAIGSEAVEAIISNPADYENIMAAMDAEIKAYVNRNIMD